MKHTHEVQPKLHRQHHVAFSTLHLHIFFLHFCTQSLATSDSTEPVRKCRSTRTKRAFFASCSQVWTWGCDLDDPAPSAAYYEGLLKSHANDANDPSLPTALACSENSDTTFAQEVAGAWCPTSRLSMASTSASLIFMQCGTNPAQTPNICPRWSLEADDNASYAIFISL